MKRARIFTPLSAFPPGGVQEQLPIGRAADGERPRRTARFCYYFHSIGDINGLYPFRKNEYSTAAVKAV